jgi:hypothetical protein
MERWPGIIALIAMLAFSGCARAANPSPNIPCTLPGGDEQTSLSLDAMAPAIRAELARQFGDPTGQHIKMAARDQDFNVTDAIGHDQEGWPFQRFIQGGRSGKRWYVWYEYGGIAYGLHAAIWDLPDNAGTPLLILSASLPSGLCEFTLKHWRDPAPATPAKFW